MPNIRAARVNRGPEPITSPTQSRGVRPATIRDVAAMAGVSHQTVSRFLKGDASVRPQTREHIAAAIEQLNYRPNRAAWSLTTGKTRSIAVLILELDDLGPARTLKGAIQAAHKAGYVLDIIALDVGDRDEIASAIATIRQQHLAGLLSLDYTYHMARALAEAELEIPFLISGSTAGNSPEEIDDPPSAGIPALVDHLASLGHSRLLHVAGPITWPAARRRARAFASAVGDRGLHSAGMVYGDWSAKSGFDAIANYGQTLDFTAVVAANDRMALGAIRALHDRGMHVPDDVSVTGIDDLADTGFYSPSLTTLRVDFEREGRRAFHTLLSRIEGTCTDDDVIPPAQLVLRESTGPVAS